MKEFRCPACGTSLGTSGLPTTMAEILVALDALAASDRAFLRARVLARYDVGGRSLKINER